MPLHNINDQVLWDLHSGISNIGSSSWFLIPVCLSATSFLLLCNLWFIKPEPAYLMRLWPFKLVQKSVLIVFSIFVIRPVAPWGAQRLSDGSTPCLHELYMVPSLFFLLTKRTSFLLWVEPAWWHVFMFNTFMKIFFKHSRNHILTTVSQ